MTPAAAGLAAPAGLHGPRGMHQQLGLARRGHRGTLSSIFALTQPAGRERARGRRVCVWQERVGCPPSAHLRCLHVNVKYL